MVVTDEAKRCIEALRVRCRERNSCDGCAKDDYCHHHGDEALHDFAADLIESLAAEPEQVTQERDGLSIMPTSATSAAETYKHKLDAALADMKAIAEKTGCCHCCVHQPDINPDGSCDRFDPQNPGECWEWRGVQE